MVSKASLLAPAVALLLAVTPHVVWAQSQTHGGQSELAPAIQPATDIEAPTEAGSVVAALRVSTHYNALLAPPDTGIPTAEELQQDEETMPSAPAAAASKGSGTGLGFMIGGAAALVGGLLIGGTGGNLIAAGGVALGVYGAIIYF